MPAQALDRPLRAPFPWRSEGTLFLVAVILLFLYIAARAVLVPITYEEAERFHRFIQEAGLKPIGAPWGAADQPFTVVLADLLVRLLGDGRAVLRIPAVLCFPLYAWYVWRCGSVIGNALIRRCTLAALVALPLVLDFFSLFSGYGPATAFLLGGLWHAASFLHLPERGRLIRALLMLFVAALGMPELLPLFAVLAAVLVRHWATVGAPHGDRVARLLAWLPIALVLALLINGAAGTAATPVPHHEGDDGIVGALLRHVFGDNLALLRWVTLAAFLVCAWTALRSWLDAEPDRAMRLLALCVTVIVVDLVVRTASYYIGDAPFPSPASTIHLAPLFLLACAITLERHARVATYRRWAALVLLVFPARLVLALNTDMTALWPREGIPDAFYDAVAQQQQAQWRGSSLVGLERMARCWSFGTRERPELGLPAMQVRDLNSGEHDALIVERHQSEGLMDRYRMVDEVPHHGLRLLMHEPPLHMTVVRDTALNLPLRADEYRILLELDATALRDHAHLVELQGLFACDTLPMDSPILVWEVRDSSDQQLRYEGFKLLPPDPTMRRPVLVACALDAMPPTAQRTTIYLWNPAKTGYALTRARLRIHQR